MPTDNTLNYELAAGEMRINTRAGKLVATIEHDPKAEPYTWLVRFDRINGAGKRFVSLEAAKYYVLAIWIDNRMHEEYVLAELTSKQA